ncbi:MAG: CRISPR-associated endonuclease Cas1 [Thermodesulfovibrio sp.]|uniref:CRISPR-associated endonuclease Cas1 n=1 Tax=Thermodesulfovibrio sp. N1 TaxID=1871110 RepID=UPI00083A0F4F|nr:CRISPR-associated endonuclease Cas1 [Thermodesulfovibrio sp. N1]MDI6714685.1 CRISPR-associated endonuclease Cas1 [Thermodesulfovibrio sp.]ODA44135.1 Retron-type RNA-directed DNA polymerase [Thermodesulfovibrio sp. N1]
MKKLFKLEDLTWHRIRADFVANHTLSISPYSIVEAVIQDIKTFLDWQKPLFFHIDGKPLKVKIHKNEKFSVSIILINHTTEESHLLANSLYEYFQDPWNSRNISLKKIYPPQLRKIDDIINENSYLELLNQKEICIEFLTPLPIKPLHPKKRCYINKTAFINLFFQRIEKLYPFHEGLLIQEKAFDILFYWCYDELIVPSSSQPGNNRYINGCIGKVYFRGDISQIFKLLIICSELHLGTSLSYARGYYIIHKTSASYLTSMPLKELLQFYVEKNKDNLHNQSINQIARELLIEFLKGTYIPKPYTAFKLEGTEFLTGQLYWKDFVIQSLIYRILKNPIDNLLPLSVVAFRPHISEKDIKEKIEEALQLGFNKTLVFTIKGFYSDVNHEKLIEILSKYIPLKDHVIIKLIERFLKVGYTFENNYYETPKGLPPGSPLSPLLANLYLIEVDNALNTSDIHILRHADTYLLMSTSEDILTEKLQTAKQLLRQLKLSINENSIKFGTPQEPIKFAGITITEKQKDKILRKPLYITTPGTYLNLSSDTIKISFQDQNNTIPINRISEIIITTDTTLTTPLIRKCAKLSIPITISHNFNSPVIICKSNFKSHYDSIINHILRYRSLSEESILLYAKEIATLKIKGYEILFARKKTLSKALKEKLSLARQKILQSQSIDIIRGYEAIASKDIYNELNKLIKKPQFQIKGRKRLKPDPINSLMNLCSHLIFNRIRTFVYAYSLNPYLGFLHSCQNNYESLVADIHELMRAKMDAFIIKLINLDSIKISDFKETNTGFIMNSSSVNEFIIHFEEYLNTFYNSENRTLHDYINIQINHIKQWVTAQQEEISFEIPW